MFEIFSYNVDIARAFGVMSAIMLQYISQQIKTQSQQGVDVSHIAVSRQDIYRRTGIQEDKQMLVENSLSSCRVMTVTPVKRSIGKNYYYVDEDALMKTMSSRIQLDTIYQLDQSVCGNSESAQKQKCQSKKQHKTQRQKTIERLHTFVVSSNYSEIYKQKMCDWIDAVYQKPNGFMSESGIDISIKELMQYTDKEDCAIAILNIAIKNGYRDIIWAIQYYEKQNQVDSSMNFCKYSDIQSDGMSDQEEVF